MDFISVLVVQSIPTLCDLMDCSLPGSSIHRILQARILEWVAISFSRGSSWPRDRTRVSCIAGRFFTVWATREAYQFLTLVNRPLPWNLSKINLCLFNKSKQLFFFKETTLVRSDWHVKSFTYIMCITRTVWADQLVLLKYHKEQWIKQTEKLHDHSNKWKGEFPYQETGLNSD